jgi:hypothetical protein
MTSDRPQVLGAGGRNPEDRRVEGSPLPRRGSPDFMGGDAAKLQAGLDQLAAKLLVLAGERQGGQGRERETTA